MPNETWLEVDIEPNTAGVDLQLLFEVVDPLVHSHFANDLDCWFYFWEPELRLRLRWSDPARDTELSAKASKLLNAWQAEGKFKDWWEGNHGNRGERYTGEADTYGAEEWKLHQKDWTSGCELALGLLKLHAQGRLTGIETNTLEGHWSRRVHLFSNPLFGAWVWEIVLCLEQARRYLDGLAQSDPAWKDVDRLVREALERVSARLSPQKS